jgi:MFS superfamily sulfate permease-like transporter
LAAAAFLGVVLIDILPGIVIGVILSLVALIYRSSFPEGSELGRVPLAEGRFEYVGVDAHPEAETLPKVVVYRPTGSLIFSNAEAFAQQARELLWGRTDPPAELLIVDCEQMADMDTTGAEAIISLFDELRDADVDMWLVRLHGDARVVAERAGAIEALGGERVLADVRMAAQQVRARFPELADPADDAT